MTNCLSNALAVSAILLCTLLGGSKELSAQVGYKVGARLEGFPNPTGSGSRQLLASVYYPASSDGYKAPIIKKAGGLPVLVFLHGFGALGLLYPELAFDFARAGYVVILQNTAKKNLPLQVADGAAMFPALVKEAKSKGSFYYNAIDTKRMVLGGHSVGGANVVHILAKNPGYRAGFAWSPFDDGSYTAPVGSKIKVPMGVAVGTGDIITPWNVHGTRVYKSLKTNTVKFFYVFDKAGNHASLVSWLSGKQPQALEVFTQSMKVARSLFDRVLFDSPGSLDDSIGLTGRTSRHLRSLEVDVEQPCYIKKTQDRLGQLTLFQLVARDGFAIHMLSLRRVALPTNLGILHLDPATIFILQVTNQTAAGIALYPHLVPGDPRMKGLRFPVQALVIGKNGAQLSNELMLAVPK